MRSGDETVVLVEVDEPRCTRTYSSSPCTAVLGSTGNSKCRNTRATCQDPANYLPTIKTVRYVRPQEEMLQYGPALPLLEDVSFTPGSLNLGGMDKDKSPFGTRAVMTARFVDGLDSDAQTDPYRLERLAGTANVSPSSGDATGGGVDYLQLASSASAVLNAYNGMVLKLTAGPGSPQQQPVRQYVGSTKVATVFPRWKQNWLKWSNDFTNAVYTVGDASNPKLPNSTDILDSDGGYGACKWVLNNNAVNRSFSQASTATAMPGRTDVFSYEVYIPSTNSNNPFQTYMYATNDIPTDTVNLNALTRDKWQVVSYKHKWNGDATGTIVCDFHANASNTVGDKMYVRKPKLELGVAAAGEYAETAASVLALPDATTDYQLLDVLDPYQTGTYWSKWLSRNPFHAAYPCRAYIGKVGDPVSSMRVQRYVVERFDGPNNGMTTMTAKDLFSLVEKRKSMAPLASRGSLIADITSSATSAQLTPAGIGNLEYPASGYVCIGSEVMAYTRSGDVLTLTRGQLNTVQAAHSHDDLVQRVLVFSSARAHDITYFLLTTYGNVPLASIDKSAWDAAATGIIDQYTAYITEPTPVQDLVGELEEEAGFAVLPNLQTGLIDLIALRAQVPQYTVTDNEWLRTQPTLKRLDKLRASQVWVYYGQIDPTKKVDERRNYAARYVVRDVEAESSTKYGTPAIREVFSRWIPRFGSSQAKTVADRLLTMFLDPPVEAQYNISATRAGKLSLGRIYALQVREIADFDGRPAARAHAPIEITEGEDTITIKSQEVAFSVPPDPTAETLIHLDAFTNTVNMRSVWDLLYPPPVSGQKITFQVDAGITIGSINTGLYALDTGNWPPGVVLKLIVRGAIQGKGGAGGVGGDLRAEFADPGAAGGPALKCRFAITIDAAGGAIWGGGGGGGGGGAIIHVTETFCGGGGGGGAGTDVGSGGAGGSFTFGGSAGGAGSPATATSGGVGGGTFGGAGVGGTGGAPGLAGSAGVDPGGGIAPGAGGAPGACVDGTSFVTWLAHGDERGPTIA